MNEMASWLSTQHSVLAYALAFLFALAGLGVRVRHFEVLYRQCIRLTKALFKRCVVPAQSPLRTSTRFLDRPMEIAGLLSLYSAAMYMLLLSLVAWSFLFYPHVAPWRRYVILITGFGIFMGALFFVAEGERVRLKRKAAHLAASGMD